MTHLLPSASPPPGVEVVPTDPGSLVGVTLTVRPISADEHRAFLREQPWASFLQTPAWAAVKSEWRAESLGWFDGDAARRRRRWCSTASCPRLKRYLAYLPEGPVIDWARRRPRAPGSTRWPPTSRARAPSASGWARRS